MSHLQARRQRRMNQQYRNHLLKRLIEVMGEIVLMFIIAFFISFILINWMSGCGESFPQADGSYQQGECVYPTDIWNDYRQSHRIEEK